VPEVLSFLAAEAGLDPAAAYSTFNMGAGYALYCAPGAGEGVVRTAQRLGHEAFVGGHVRAGEREVILEPLGVSFGGERLELGAPHE
jgi:phosphoribosylformylglycinamidine cyclo-ligase